ncbi:DNA translocase FtsK [Rubellimicrobium sp. CFH 75288]|uniref:DNA translocase FtsK n=1 Tax=Rubellimicrobium sp. CFH 75288 TaxID=2697034 RepID=UPI0014136395|nr:DNA translocase FtsK [Rubellimicrobium sp. CFH 75288]NAZ37653.1 DNA translocase FtsK [Rubellimicrobium sp. CFH 75288]
MAYPTRDRAPLLDEDTQATIERRGRELLGLCLFGAGLAVAMMLWSHAPDDPSWLLASDAPVQNWLGSFGASVAHPLVMVLGRAAWGIPLLLGVWGLRLLTHRADQRARAVFAPVALAALAVAWASAEPGAGWTASYGMGGLFGDTALSFVLTLLPFDGWLTGLALWSVAAGLVLWVAGVTRAEWVAVRQRGTLLLVLGYARAVEGGARGLEIGGRLLRGGAALAAEARARGTEGMTRGLEQGAAWLARRREEAAAAREAARAAATRMPGTALPPPPAPSASPLVRRAQDGARRAMPPPVLPPRPAPPVAPEEREDGGWPDAPDEVPLAVVDGGADALPPLVAPPRAPQPPAGGFLATLLRRARGEETAGDPAGPEEDGPGPDPERLRSRIGEAIRARSLRPLPEEPEAAPAPLPAGGAAIPSAPAPVEPGPRARRRAPADGGPRRPAPAPAAPAAPAYVPPPLDLLADPASVQRHHLSDAALEENARALEQVLDDFGVKGEIVSVRPGPVVTMYELEPAPGLKASRVIGLADDIARNMSALSARVSTVPGRNVIGIELPNERREKVVLREILSAPAFGDAQTRLPLALGKDIGGAPVVANLAKMPHLLIAGTTGSGKSVAINTMILSLLYRLGPEECRLIMIDPKMLELSVYDGIPHLLSPVVTDPRKAVVALKWVVGEMEERYRKMSKMGVRNIEGYNGRVREALEKGETFSRTVQTGFDEETGDPVFETEEIQPELLPFIVVVVDEMADLMMVAGKEIEACIQRLAQMARASGIHLIMATQRPSVDVITGTIKANFPTRISFQVTSKIDSRTILGEQGAEQLLGQGDMLYMAGGGRIARVHGPFVSDEEVEEIVTHLKALGPPAYVGAVLEEPAEGGTLSEAAPNGGAEGDDALYDMAVQIVARDRKCSTSYIQRKLAIGYNKAARLVELMEEQGVVSPANHVGKREILVPEPH